MSCFGRVTALALAAALALGGCGTPTLPASLPGSASPQIEAAFSPDAGAEDLVVRTLASAKASIHLAAYSFTSPAVVRALLDAHKRGVEVMVLIDDRGNRSAASLAAIRLLQGADIPVRRIAVYAIHHDKYAVIDGETVQTGSFNYSQAAARSNSENVLVVHNNSALSAQYERHWQNRWGNGSSPQ